MATIDGMSENAFKTVVEIDTVGDYKVESWATISLLFSHSSLELSTP